MASSTAQLNARMDATLKKSGDEALASIGFSPSRAVRALWGTAAKRGSSLASVKALLESADAEQSSPDDRIASLRAVQDDVLAFLKDAEIDISSLARSRNEDGDDAALAEALLARMEERGLA